MRRRSWLKLGVAATVALAIGGGTVALLDPGLRDGRLAAAGRRVFTHIGRGLLEGSLPAQPAEHAAALAGLVDRVDALVASLPAHARQELSQLLSLLAAGLGRRTLAGLSPDWSDATAAEIQQALQSMRVSTLSLRQQAYHALHDITAAAYFSDRGTWRQLGYPGPIDI